MNDNGPSANSSSSTVRLAPESTVEEGIARPEDTTALVDGSGVANDLYRDYAVIRKIGDGGMGVVYLAKDRRLGRYVAIKRLKPTSSGSKTLRQRFLHEARAEAALSHPGIVHVYTLGEDLEGPYIVMEYVAGSLAPTPSDPPPASLTLEQHIQHQGPLALSEAAELMLKICRAVEYAHMRGVIHRDLKPANILLDPYGDPKVADFGLARISRAEDSHLTVPGEKLLSLGYGAPEQEDDAAGSDNRADIYGLGALYYFILTGQNPRYFREEDLPIPVRAPLCKAMSRDRNQRHNSVHELIEELEPLRTTTRVEAPTVKSTWRCKWCDTVNPVSIRFCAECGWDGVEPCRECGADLFVGMPFCRRCGASARDYEQISMAIAEAEKLLAKREYDKLLSGSRFQPPPSFEPTGENGRAMLEKLRAIHVEGEKKRTRCEEIPELISIEMDAENYERAERYIRELRELEKGGADRFEAELARIPEGILHRDLARVRRLYRTGDRDGGRKLLQSLRRKHPSDEGVQKLVQMDRRQNRNTVIRRVLRAAVLVVLVYVFSVPPASHYATSMAWLKSFYTPVLRLYTGYPETTRGYIMFWHRRLPVEFTWFDWDVAHVDDHPVLRRTLSDLKGEIEGAEADRVRLLAGWSRDYLTSLHDLRERYKNEGDFGMCKAADDEILRFDKTKVLLPLPVNSDEGAAPSLTTLEELRGIFVNRKEELERGIQKQRQEAIGRALERMEALRSELTKSNRMVDAERVDKEIKRISATTGAAE